MLKQLPTTVTLVAICLFQMTVTADRPAAAETKLFIVAGQSNASGRANSRLLPTELLNQLDVPYWYDTDRGNSGNAFGALIPLGRQFGPEMKAARVLADRLSDEVAIVKVAVGGTTLAPVSGNDWDPNSTGELYDDLFSNVTAARDALIADGKQVELAGLFWMQGESDGKSGGGGQAPPPQPATADAYQGRLTDFILQTRTDLGVAQLPFFIGRLNVGDNVSNFSTSFGNFDFTPTIQAAQAAVAASDPNAYLIDTSQFDLLIDRIHFDHNGQVDLGEAFARAYLQTVPEPSTAALSLFGIAWLRMIRRRRLC